MRDHGNTSAYGQLQRSAGVYANHLTADETGSRVRAAYGAEKYDKLAMLKARYDPGNFFRLNHNIPPRGA